VYSIVNSLFNVLFDVLLWPLQALPATLQLCALGLPAAVFALLVFRFTSDQDGIETAKDKIKAHLMELRLYKDDFGVTMRAQGKILRHNLTYLRHALVPMAVMIGPFVLMLIQVESRFALRSLVSGEATTLTVAVDGDEQVSALATALRVPDGLARETPPLRIDETGEIVWRIRARGPGEYELGIRVGEAELAKRVVVAGEGAKFSPAVYRSNDLNTLLYPVEKSLAADTPVSAVHLVYPRDRATFAGLSSASWIFFAASMVFGFALRGVFGVTF
jgi:hypothetical protein